MRKVFVFALLVAVLAAFAGSSPAVAQQEEIKVYVDGKLIRSDVPPYIARGRVMVPLRFVAEAFGCGVVWAGPDAEMPIQVWVPVDIPGEGRQEIGVFVLRPGDDDIVFRPRKTTGVGRTTLAGRTALSEFHSQYFQTDVPPEIRGGRTFVPLRILSEAMGCQVDWNESTRTVTVVQPDAQRLVKLNPWLDDAWGCDLLIADIGWCQNGGWPEEPRAGLVDLYVLVIGTGVGQRVTINIPGVPVVVSVDGREIGRGEAEAWTIGGVTSIGSGSDFFAARVTANLPPGSHTIQARILADGFFDRDPSNNSKTVNVTVVQ